MKKLYTLIIYTPSQEGWHDRCGDYHKGEDSELDMTYYTEDEMDELVKKYGHAKFYNPDAEIKLLINGHDAYNSHPSLTKEEQEDLALEADRIENLATEHYYKYKAAKEQKDAEDKQRKLQEQEMMKIREQKRKEDAEKAELVRLQAKYGKH